tara:strand:- start:5042 stop:6133 length:1092 start_codon:yes stop_codon:yes gene_type:complete
MFRNIYKNKKVLITGHTGFKGSWLSIWLNSLGAKVYGISCDIPTQPSHYNYAKIYRFIKNYKFEINEYKKLKHTIDRIKPDFIFHLAAQSLVKKSILDPKRTWTSNLVGTMNILESLRNYKAKCSVVIITSDKCYFNKEWSRGYKENDKLGAIDPYGASKSAAEILFKSYFETYYINSTNISLATARAGNVIGGGDWAENRLIPDCIKAWSKKQKVLIRNPKSTRPWQHVLEPLSGYLSLGANLYFSKKLSGQSFNFGPSENKEYNVEDVVNLMSNDWKNVKWKIKLSKRDSFKESNLLKLNCKKAKYHLNWNATLNVKETIKLTTNWYKNFYNNRKLTLIISLNQIEYYTQIAKKRKLSWTK